MKIVLMYQPTTEHRRRLRDVAPHGEFRVVRDEASARREAMDADAILGNRYFLQSLPTARRVRWMQSNSVGVDLILQGLPARPSFTITSAKGVYDDEVAEHALALTLALTRGLHLARDHQAQRAWVRQSLTTVSRRTALILGWGGSDARSEPSCAGWGSACTGSREARARFRRTPGSFPPRHGEHDSRTPTCWSWRCH